MTSTRKRTPDTRAADPWWGIDEAVAHADPPKTSGTAIGSRSSSRRAPGTRGTKGARPRRRGLARVGWLLLGLLVAPIDLTRRTLARSPRLRRYAIRFVVMLAIAAILTCSVGVILINNVVIGRTAELGELDDRRRELRRDNALLGAQAARLSSPDVVFRRATKELGMVRTDDVPKFIYLVPGSRTLTPWQRQRVAAKARRGRAAATSATTTRAKQPAATPADKPATAAATPAAAKEAR
jgi:hypothetical protein